MDSKRNIRNLVLIGFMATGKSTVGQMVAGPLGFRFVDTDALIESRLGQSISEIFAKEGEARFRECERQLVAEMSQWTNTVIATGGGLAAHGDNLTSLKQHALVVCLWASPKTIWQRACRHGHRPLLRDPYPLQRIQDLLDTRIPFYRQADVLVNTELRPLKRVAQQVLSNFLLAQRSDALRA
jgi:shikimate kinase